MHEIMHNEDEMFVHPHV